MSEPHVVSALRAKRAEVSGHVADLERKLARHPHVSSWDQHRLDLAKTAQAASNHEFGRLDVRIYHDRAVLTR